ncbi:1,4-dihydroxy-2-naphthoate polyprenyltransferase [Candidatus Providencia siddallii]|uniref:1,4-dihydroxy-2-naphthoate octaprenyltransferase n=1 Tax=Candidatus Providencia siddallii TaxID=1715285 RepID=A0ABM9NPS4_9GAMM
MTNYQKAWIESFRIKTLSLGFSSILIGSILAQFKNNFHWKIFFLLLITIFLLQILSNLANDYGDNIKGCDAFKRIGNLRGMQKGLINKSKMKKALKLNIFIICISGLILIFVSCKNLKDIIIFSIIGIASIISAITYTIGKKPYGYIGLGDIFVLFFFGWISVISTYYLQSNTFDTITLLPSTACGFLSVAVLNINNMRDIKNDIKSKKKTLVVRIGIKYAKIYHAIIIIIAILCFICFNLLYINNIKSWLFLLGIPMLINNILYVFKSSTAKSMNLLLEHMINSSLIINILFCIGIIFSK